jgi:hypothetical protein
MKPGKLLLAMVIVVVLLSGCIAPSAPTVEVEKSSTTLKTTTTLDATKVTTPAPIRGVPSTSASAITSPPPSMVGINTHTEVYGQDADPNMITLGPKLSFNPNNPGYVTKHSMAWELKIHGTPVLAPIDMILVGFQNSSAYRITDGQNMIWIYGSSLPVQIGRV